METLPTYTSREMGVQLFGFSPVRSSAHLIWRFSVTFISGMTCIDDIVDEASEATRVLHEGHHNRVADDDGKAHLYFGQGPEVHEGFRPHFSNWDLGFGIRDS